ncbi:hypothetical protein NMY22_g10357 [Coprinellus aureogranulatus]|nr:hypothetical protein NMY22_g10357 [Coprinellus aureogranulatus]
MSSPLRHDSAFEGAHEVLDELDVAYRAYDKLKASLEVAKTKNTALTKERDLLEEENFALRLENEYLEKSLKSTQSESEGKVRCAMSEVLLARKETESAKREATVAQIEIAYLNRLLDGFKDQIRDLESAKEDAELESAIAGQEASRLYGVIEILKADIGDLERGSAWRDEELRSSGTEAEKLRWMGSELVQIAGIRIDPSAREKLTMFSINECTLIYRPETACFARDVCVLKRVIHRGSASPETHRWTHPKCYRALASRGYVSVCAPLTKASNDVARLMLQPGSVIAIATPKQGPVDCRDSDTPTTKSRVHVMPSDPSVIYLRYAFIHSPPSNSNLPSNDPHYASAIPGTSHRTPFLRPTESKIGDVRKEVESLEGEKALAETENLALRQRNEALEKALKETQAERDDQMQRAINEARAVKEEKKKLATECSIHKTEISIFRSRLEDGNKQISDLELELEGQMLAFDTLNVKLDDQKKENSKLKKKAERREKELEVNPTGTAKRELEVAKREAMYARCEVGHLHRAIADMQSYTAELLHIIEMEENALGDAVSEVEKLRWMCATLVQTAAVGVDGDLAQTPCLVDIKLTSATTRVT